MGLFDFLTSTRRPESGAAALPADEVRRRLMALNRESAPYRIVDGGSDGVDVVAEWKIVDAQWYEIFARAGLKKVFRIFLRLRPESNEVRALDREYEVEWRAGVPELSLARRSFSGQKQSIEFGKRYAFKENLEFGEVYEYKFQTGEMKKPIQDAVTSAGWTYKGVVPPLGKL
ncbi:MAG: hypothetical protein GEU28_02925 [Dehalococcoidia bacterium]|nr:hypothetical protein [Dehalococcoidia bacterium]